MEVGRSGRSMMMSAGLAWALRELRGHRQQIGKSAAPTDQRYPFSLPPRARARRRRFERALTPTGDLHRPARQRCGCWPTSTFLFSGLLFADSGADDGGWAIGAIDDDAAAAPAMVPVEGREVPGQSTTIAKFCSTDMGALSLARSAADRKDQRNLAALITMAPLSRA
jgi:hypothetical protein